MEQPAADEGEVNQSIPGGRSIAHHTLNNHLCQFLSIDIETGGDLAGIIEVEGILKMLHYMLHCK